MLMKNHIIDTILVLAVIIVLVALAFRVRTTAPMNMIVIMKTSGMTCAHCSDSIVQAMQRVPGIATTEVDVPHGLVAIGFSTEVITPDALVRRVTANGFSSSLLSVVTPQQYKQVTGRDFGRKVISPECCSGSGRCASDHKL